jgi:hypothetical protein
MEPEKTDAGAERTSRKAFLALFYTALFTWFLGFSAI